MRRRHRHGAAYQARNGGRPPFRKRRGRVSECYRFRGERLLVRDTIDQRLFGVRQRSVGSGLAGGASFAVEWAPRVRHRVEARRMSKLGRKVCMCGRVRHDLGLTLGLVCGDPRYRSARDRFGKAATRCNPPVPQTPARRSSVDWQEPPLVRARLPPSSDKDCWSDRDTAT